MATGGTGWRFVGTAGRLVCDAGCVQAAQKDPVGVAMGGTVGHAVCTGIAVVGGRMLATRFDSPSRTWRWLAA